MHYGMYSYAWDLAEEGIATVTGRLRDAGLDTVVLATSYHAGKFLRPHAPRRKVYFPEDGTIYFRPDLTRYGRIKPRLSTLTSETDILRELEHQAPDLRCVGWTVGLHNTPLGKAHPDLVARNLFGDPLYNSLCPAQGDVRDYLVNLCADLGQAYDLAEIAIETPGWQAYRHGHHHEFELVELTPRAEAVLGLCFCPTCCAGARSHGVDAEVLSAHARLEMENFLANGGDLATDIENDPDWRAFHVWRAGVVTNLVREVRQALRPAVGLAVIPTTQTPNALCWIEGSDLAGLAEAAGRLEVPAYQCGVAAITADVGQVRRSAGQAAIGFILRPSYPHLLSPGDVGAAVRTLHQAGACSLSFYNYGHLRLSALDWIRQAMS